MYNIRIPTLPLVTLTWTSESVLIAAGHDCQPLIFSGSPNGWEPSGSLDDSTAPKSGAGRGGAVVGRLNSTAFNTFRNADSRGGSAKDTELTTVHQNTITSLRSFGRGKVSSSGVDGKLVIWDVGR